MTVYKTSDGVEITPGLRVFTNDWEWGTVDAKPFERGGLSDPGSPYFQGWFDVVMDNGRRSLYDGSRMTTRKP